MAIRSVDPEGRPEKVRQDLVAQFIGLSTLAWIYAPSALRTEAFPPPDYRGGGKFIAAVAEALGPVEHCNLLQLKAPHSK